MFKTKCLIYDIAYINILYIYLAMKFSINISLIIFTAYRRYALLEYIRNEVLV